MAWISRSDKYSSSRSSKILSWSKVSSRRMLKFPQASLVGLRMASIIYRRLFLTQANIRKCRGLLKIKVLNRGWCMKSLSLIGSAEGHLPIPSSPRCKKFLKNPELTSPISPRWLSCSRQTPKNPNEPFLRIHTKEISPKTRLKKIKGKVLQSDKGLRTHPLEQTILNSVVVLKVRHKVPTIP